MDRRDQPQYRIWRNLFDITEALRDAIIRKYIEEGNDISVRQHMVMKKVCDMMESEPDGIPLKDLASGLCLTPGTVSELVETLVRKGALKRVQNPNDRRAVMISVTDKSLETLRSSEEKLNRYTDMICQDLAENEKEILLKLLAKISSRLDAIQAI